MDRRKGKTHRLFHPSGGEAMKCYEYLLRWGKGKKDDTFYEEDGFLRLRELDTASWHRAFEKYYTTIRYLEFPYPWQEGMNRLFLLKKN